MTALSRRCAALLAAGTLAALLAGCGGSAGTRADVTAAPAGGSRALALATGERLLESLALPAGSWEIRKRPVPASLQEPAVHAGGPGFPLDVYRLYRLPVTVADAIAFLRTHRPAGSAPTGFGGNGALAYAQRHVPAGIDVIFLVEELIPHANGTSDLRADAEVTWYPSRSAAEYLIASRFKSVSISPDSNGGGASVTGGQRFIQPLVAALNSMPAAPPPDYLCPPAVDSFRLVFTPSAPGQDTVVTGGPCFVDSVTAGGRAQPDLVDTARIDLLVKRLLRDYGAAAAGHKSARKHRRGLRPILLVPPTQQAEPTPMDHR